MRGCGTVGVRSDGREADRSGHEFGINGGGPLRGRGAGGRRAPARRRRRPRGGRSAARGHPREAGGGVGFVTGVGGIAPCRCRCPRPPRGCTSSRPGCAPASPTCAATTSAPRRCAARSWCRCWAAPARRRSRRPGWRSAAGPPRPRWNGSRPGSSTEINKRVGFRPGGQGRREGGAQPGQAGSAGGRPDRGRGRRVQLQDDRHLRAADLRAAAAAGRAGRAGLTPLPLRPIGPGALPATSSTG